jgi:putative oxidoreductase
MPAAGLLILRIVLAAVLVAHGTHDLFGVFETPGIGHGGLTARAAYMAAIGLTPAMSFAIAGGIAELGGGALLALGILTRWVSVAVAAFQLLLLWKDAWNWGFFLNWTAQPGRGQGLEFILLIIAILACLFFAGPGEWSVDGRKNREAARRAAGRARLRSK